MISAHTKHRPARPYSTARRRLLSIFEDSRLAVMQPGQRIGLHAILSSWKLCSAAALPQRLEFALFLQIRFCAIGRNQVVSHRADGSIPLIAHRLARDLYPTRSARPRAL